MDTQVTFTTDKTLKQEALAKAKREGFPLKTVLVYALKGFVTGAITFGLTAPEVESDVEAIQFTDSKLNAKATKLAKLLK